MKIQDESLDLPHFDLTAIANATSNFSFNNLLGHGGFGPVYKVKHNAMILCSAFLTVGDDT